MNILAGGIRINTSFIHEAEFKSLEKYKTNERADFILSSVLGEPIFERMDLDFETEYYQIYKTEKGIFQLQKGNGIYLGGLLYQDKVITMYIYQDSFLTEYLLSQYAFVYWIRHYTKSIFIHSSSIAINDMGFLLCAKSGTGKSTHRRLWERNAAICINDDKNVISYIDGKLYIMPNPWSGKHFCDYNKTVELKAVVFLYQNEYNVCEQITPDRAMPLLLNQIQLPSSNLKDNWNLIVDKLLELRLLRLGCTMDMEAYQVLYKKMEDLL